MHAHYHQEAPVRTQRYVRVPHGAIDARADGFIGDRHGNRRHARHVDPVHLAVDLLGVAGAAVRDAMERHLRTEPTRGSRSKIKRLRGVGRPHYGLRVADLRIFHDVSGVDVEVLAVVSKNQACEWLAQFGEAQ